MKELVLGQCRWKYLLIKFTNGKLFWKLNTNASCFRISHYKKYVWFILAGVIIILEPLIFILEKKFGALMNVNGPITSTPIIAENKILFAAWDSYLYALDRINGKLLWKWNNGTSIRNFSPAACTPVVHNSEVYIVAPDRYITAIDLHTGLTLWRNNDATVRESTRNFGRWEICLC